MPKPSDYRRDLRKLFERDHRFRPGEIFRDFCEATSLAITNSRRPMVADHAENEARYARIAAKYGDDFADFPKALGLLVMAMEHESTDHHRPDVLGETFEALELQNAGAGQFFTPFAVCTAMAKLTIDEAYIAEAIAERGRVTVTEPACGCGRTVLALSNELRRLSYDPTQTMVATLVDVDQLCCQMAHITLTLAAVPARIIHGNSLSLESWGEMCTPMFDQSFRIAMLLARLDASPIEQTVSRESEAEEREAEAKAIEHDAAKPTPTLASFIAPADQTISTMPRQLALF